MTTPDDLLAMLELLLKAYPDKKLEEGTLRLYMGELCDIPANLLMAACRRHIKSSPWFPRISELRALAASIAGTDQFEELVEQPPNPLSLEAHRLEQAFTYHCELDEAAWNKLIEQLEKADRLCKAASVRERLQAFKEMMAKEAAEKQAQAEPATPTA